MKITKIRKKKHKNRTKYLIYINDEYVFTLTKQAIKKFNIKENRDIEVEDLDVLKEKIELFEAERALIYFLRHRFRSQKEIIKKLRSKGFSYTIIEKLIKKYQKAGYIDDRKFAEIYLLDLINYHPQSKYLLRTKLKKRGIDNDKIKELMDKYVTYEKEIEMGKQLLVKKRSKFVRIDSKDRYKKVLAFLQRKGFSFEVAKEIVGDFMEELTES